MADWPTKEHPKKTYKYTSIYLKYSQTLGVVERETYSLLELLGDVGGL